MVLVWNPAGVSAVGQWQLQEAGKVKGQGVWLMKGRGDMYQPAILSYFHNWMRPGEHVVYLKSRSRLRGVI